MLGTGELDRSVGVMFELVTGVQYRFVDQGERDLCRVKCYNESMDPKPGSV
jgi:hypothetical protein